MKIGLTIGTFDLLHPGHLRFLEACRDRCEWLTVAVNPDDFVERFKRRPVMTMVERIEQLTACRWVDYAMVNLGCEDSGPTIVNSRAELLFHGDDWTGQSLLTQLGVTEEWLDGHGVELVYLPYTANGREPVSTSLILERIRGAS